MPAETTSSEFPVSDGLLERARRVIPTGVWGHNRFPAFLSPGNYPVFARRARGARFEDVDGREYIDYVCGYGAMITGFANPEVDAAATARTAEGDCLNQPTETSVLLAERLTSMIPDMAWSGFGKNGSDAVSTAFLIARAHTGRARIVCVNGAYHGSHSWCNWCNMGAGRPAEDSAMVLRVDWNDVAGLRDVFEREGEDIAAVLMTPFHHPIGARAELPSAQWWPAVEATCRAWGALLIVDDVRAGFRLDLAGSHRHFGFSPDLICLSKALANTHPLSAVLGVERCREAAEQVFAAGTFWSASAPMAAALVNLEILSEPGRFDGMQGRARAWCDGMIDRARAVGLTLEVTGPPTMPTLTFAEDVDNALMNAFAEAMVARGVFVHPSHNLFFSAAHGDAEVGETLETATAALEAIAHVSAA